MQSKNTSNSQTNNQDIESSHIKDNDSVLKQQKNTIDILQTGKQEEITIEQINKLRLAYGVATEETDRWDDIVNETFFLNQEKMINLFLDNFGFIPEELYKKLIFLTNNNFSLASNFFNILRNKERKTYNKQRKSELKEARNIFLKYIFLDKKVKKDLNINGKKIKKGTLKGICSQVQNAKEEQISLDSNGVWIRIFNKKDNIVSHYPYQKLDNELINYWFENKWIDENQLLEIQNRKASSSENIVNLEDIENSQLELISKKLGLNTQETVKQIVNKIIYNPEQITKAIIEYSLIIPDIVFDYIIQNFEAKKAFFILFNFAEQINLNITKEKQIEDNNDYLLAYSSLNRFTQRKKIANNDSSLYVAHKAINKALSIKLSDNGLKQEFYLVKSQKDPETNLGFVEVVTDSGISRNLINPNKHLSYKSKQNLEGLKEFNLEKLQNLEVLFDSFFIAKKALENLEGNYSNNIMLFDENDYYIQQVLIFSLNYFPIHFYKLSTIARDLLISKDGKALRDFINYTKIVFEKLKFSIDDFISKGQNLDILETSIKKKTLRLDKTFLEKIKAMGLKSRAYDEELTSSNEEINIVELQKLGNKETYSIDYFSELSAINALNLKQNKQLVVVSGGCKEVSENGINSLDIFSSAIISSAIKHNANLSIPGTQSGIGISMSKRYINYKNETGFISGDNTMRMFSISPRNNMADNNYESDGKYAPVVNDHIYIPCNADWGINDEKIINAGYFQFIEGAEQIYNRLDRKKQRLHIIGNGGLFTIAEVNAALKNNSKLVLVKGTGRFADIASTLLDTDNIGKIILKLNEINTYKDFIDIIIEIDKILKNSLEQNDYEEIIKKDLGNIKLVNDILSEIGDKKINTLEELFLEISLQIKKRQIDITPKQILYSIYLIEFLKLSSFSKNKPISCDLKDLGDFLDKII